MSEYSLRFEFPGGNGALAFARPFQVIAVHRVQDALPALAAVQRAVDAGAYAAGYVAYEAAPAFDAAMQARVAQAPPDFPLVWFGLFGSPAVLPDMPPPPPHDDLRVSEWQTATTYARYLRDVAAIRAAIGRGETYQVNYTLRLRSLLQSDVPAFFQNLMAAQGSGFGAYLDLGRYRILSASPELFFHRQDDHIVTRPMKGTAPRHNNPGEDARIAQELAASEKNRAENIMIVDLLRNDLGRLARTGTVRVTRLFDIERYPTVWQMTSTVEAELDTRAKPVGLPEIFTALFPCGSVTGAPKISAMRFIADLETSPRNIYCGAIGYVTPNGEAVFSVAIRTLLLDAQTGMAEYGVGGGITWDSQAEDEYAEALAKAAILNSSFHPPATEIQL